MVSPQEVLTFWYQELEPKDWWVGGEALDLAIAERFGETVEAALRGELYGWRTTAEGRLAEIICLDQFPRNIYRGSAKAFAGDGLALVLTQELILSGIIKDLPEDRRNFALMPLMHAESRAIHVWAAEVCVEAGATGLLDSLKEHSDVIEQFGRYPSRNAALGRPSTPEELTYLKDGKSWGQG